MSKFVGIIAGVAEIAGGIVSEVFLPGNPLGGYLIGAGIGTTISGIGTAMSNGPLKGFGTATRNPIAARNVIYGRDKVPGTIVFINEFGTDNKYLDLVFVLAAHPCKAVDSLLFDNQRIQLSTNRSTFTGVGDSFTPVQQTVNIFHISRTSDVVTVVLQANIPLLTVGDYVIISGITGDRTLNGKFSVAQIASQVIGGPGSITFSYICGGPPSIVDNQGTVKTTWPDYRAKVHMEVLLGDHTATFPGMLGGTAYDGDTSNLVFNPDNPWTAQHLLLGCCAVFLRLHYNDEVFANGLPNISFLVSGKKDISDPRNSPATVGYTENSALCIADYLSSKKFGFQALYGTEIPIPELVAAANICDERVPIAIGGTEPRYTCNGQFPLTMKRGDVLQNLLTSCGGRLTYSGGQFVIHPAAWPGTSLGIGQRPASAVLSYTTAHTFGTGYGAIAAVTLGSGYAMFNNTEYSAETDANTWSSSTDQWSQAVGPLTSSSNPIDTTVTFQIIGTIFGSAAPADKFFVYDCYLNVTFEDGSTGTFRPSIIGVSSGSGGVLNAANAIDGNPATFAEVNRTAFGGGSSSPGLQLSGFLLISATPGVPDTGVNAIAASRFALAQAAGPFRWRSKVGIRDLYNGVKGTFISPANNWQSSDIPPYAQDALHGYGSGAGTTGSGGSGGTSSGTGGAGGSGGSNSSGTVRIFVLAQTNWDPFTILSTAYRSFIQSNVRGMGAFSPFFDAQLSWFPSALAYVDSYGIPNDGTGNALIAANPTWVFRDGSGNPLYIPFQCSGGVCPQYAGNIADAGFRAYMVDRIGDYLALEYAGIWLDDVNLDITRVANGSGVAVAPIDPATSLAMTNTALITYFAAYLQQIRAAWPSVTILHNSLWGTTASAQVDAQIGAADIINLERGFGDVNLTGGTGSSSIYALMNFVDHVHSLGKVVVIQDYFVGTDLNYSTAGYLLINNGGDYLNFLDLVPDGSWPSNLFGMTLGAATSTRYKWNGLWRRDFTTGLVLLNEPGASTVTVSLPQTLYDKNGTAYTTVTLAAKNGIVLHA